MPDEKRVKEAEKNVKNYLNEGMLRKVSADRGILEIIRSNCKESLNVAEILQKNNHSSLWTIVCSYFKNTMAHLDLRINI